MSDWQTKRLGDILQLNYGKSLSVKNRVEGGIPVYGSNGIVGSHNEAIVDVPGLVVGRKGSAGQIHRSLGPFCPIDTTFYVTAVDAPETDLEFLFYLLRHIDLTRITGDVGVPGLNREMAYMETVRFPAALPEQKKIAHILSTVQRAIEAQDQIIQTTTELKRALMHKLFNEGLRGEPQKQTEIGLVPESWEVVELGTFCRVQSGFAFRSQDYVKGEGGIPITKIGDIQDGSVFYTEKSSYVPKEFWGDRRLDQFKLQSGDVLIALTGATTGKSGVFQHSFRAFLNQRAGRFLPDDEGLKRSFLPFLVRQPYFQIEISSNILVAAQGNISPKRIEKIKVGLPEPSVQEEIASSLDALDRKVACSQAKRTAFQDLFRTLLHELMTAKTRVV